MLALRILFGLLRGRRRRPAAETITNIRLWRTP